MPEDGKAAVTIDSKKDGNRVRALGMDCPKGRRFVQWDCKDGEGNLVAPGEYTVRILARPAVPSPSTHDGRRDGAPYASLISQPTGGCVAAFSLLPEGGSVVSVMESTGRIVYRRDAVQSPGDCATAYVSASNAFYAIGEKWVAVGNGATNVQFRISGFGWEDGRQQRIDIGTANLPESVFFTEPRPLGMTNAALAGAAFAAGRLYVADRIGNCVRVFPLAEEPGRAAVSPMDAVIAASAPGVMTADENGVVYLADGQELVRLDLPTRGLLPLCDMRAVPASVAVRGRYAYWLPQDGGRVLSCPLGGWFRSIRPFGAWEKERLVSLASICITSGAQLWAAEAKAAPKCLAIGDTRSGRAFSERLYPECDCQTVPRDSGSQVLETAVTVSVSAVQIENAELRGLNSLPQRNGGPKALVIPFQVHVAADGASLPHLAEWGAGPCRVRLGAAYDAVYLYLRYDCEEPSPWVNKGKSWNLLSETGDAIELRIGETRVVYAPSGLPDGDVAVRYRGPANDVSQLPLPEWARTRIEASRYTVCLAVPLAELGLDAAKVSGQSYPADFGVVFGDHDGTTSLLRLYWADKTASQANNTQGESASAPQRGTVTFR